MRNGKNVLNMWPGGEGLRRTDGVYECGNRRIHKLDIRRTTFVNDPNRMEGHARIDRRGTGIYVSERNNGVCLRGMQDVEMSIEVMGRGGRMGIPRDWCNR